jgi:WD domain, G-beta repeat
MNAFCKGGFAIRLSALVMACSVIQAVGQTPVLSVEAPIPLVNTGGNLALTSSLVFFPDGKYIAAGVDKAIRIWDASTGEETPRYPPIRGQIGREGEFGVVKAIAISPDGSRLAAGGFFGENKNDANTGDIRVYETKNWSLVTVLKGHTNDVLNLRFSSTGDRLVSGGFLTRMSSFGTLRAQDRYANQLIRAQWRAWLFLPTIGLFYPPVQPTQTDLFVFGMPILATPCRLTCEDTKEVSVLSLFLQQTGRLPPAEMMAA